MQDKTSNNGEVEDTEGHRQKGETWRMREEVKARESSASFRLR
jgi:hypothetical protein